MVTVLKDLAKNVRRILTKPEGLRMTDVGPVSRSFGLDRGTPVDRYYIHRFLAENKAAISGKVLEIAENTLSKRYANEGADFEVLHVTPENPNATIVGDLTRPETLPADAVDCFICTQTYNFIYNVKQAIVGTHQLLKPGGVVLATVGGISQISRYDSDRWGDYWRFTTQSAQLLFEEVFGAGNVSVDFCGNCLATVSFLRGLSVEELKKEELDLKDKDYPLLITIRAQKAFPL